MSLFLATSIVLLLLGLVVAYAQRSRWLRWLVFLVTIVAVPASYVIGLELLGQPKPVSKEYFKKPDEVTLLGFKIVENVGFYLLIDTPEWPTPLYYFMDWDKKMAEELQEKGREAKFRGKKLKIKNPFGNHDNSPRVDHPDPPPPDPLKNIP